MRYFSYNLNWFVTSTRSYIQSIKNTVVHIEIILNAIFDQFSDVQLKTNQEVLKQGVNLKSKFLTHHSVQFTKSILYLQISLNIIYWNIYWDYYFERVCTHSYQQSQSKRCKFMTEIKLNWIWMCSKRN